MLLYNQSWRRCPRPFRRFFYIFIFSFCIGLFWTTLTALLFNIDDDNDAINNNDIDGRQPPQIFCFVLSSNNHHLTSSQSILYSWGKRCDRFYFVTRLQNTSIDLMMLEKFENLTDITPTTIARTTLDVLLYLRKEQVFTSYNWFLRATDDSYVIIPNLRRLVTLLDRKKINYPLVYVGDVEQMYDKYDISTSGSVMLFNRKALDRLIITELDSEENGFDLKIKQCFETMIYDHEFVSCIKQIGININSVDDNLILSQNLSTYRMDKRLKDLCCSPNTVAIRATNETDMFKFDFFYHHLDAISKIKTY